jgi:hypothetical protein
MPHKISNDERLRQVCVRLNNLEMATDRLPPHFGAWCAGQSGNKPAYVSFLPNALRIWNNSQCRVLGAGSGAMGQFNARVAADLRVVASYRLRAKTRTS